MRFCLLNGCKHNLSYCMLKDSRKNKKKSMNGKIIHYEKEGNLRYTDSGPPLEVKRSGWVIKTMDVETKVGPPQQAKGVGTLAQPHLGVALSLETLPMSHFEFDVFINIRKRQYKMKLY